MCLYCEHPWLAGIVVQIITCRFFDIASHSIVTVMYSRVATGPSFSNAEEVKSQEKDCSKLSLWLTDIYNGTECLYMHGRWIIAKKNSGNKWIPNLSVRIKIVTRKSPRTPCFNIYNKKFCWWTLYRLPFQKKRILQTPLIFKKTNSISEFAAHCHFIWYSYISDSIYQPNLRFFFRQRQDIPIRLLNQLYRMPLLRQSSP